MTDHAISKSAYDAAKQMAAEGYGIDDIRIRLSIPRRIAKIIVFGKKHTVRQAS